MAELTSLRPEAPAAESWAGVFWRYWTGSTVSKVGDAVTAVALPLTALLVLHAGALVVAAVTAAGYAAWALIGLPAGALVGRLPLRGTQVAMDVVRAAALLTVPIAAWAGVLHPAQLIAVAFLISVANVIFDVGNSTFLPSIVPRDQLTTRNSITTGTEATVQLAGPSLGGVLVQLLGAPASLVVDVGSYLCSAVLLRSLPRPARLAPPGSRVPLGRSIREGWHFVVRHPIIRPCVLDATVINFVCGAVMAITPVFLVRTLGATPGLVGVLLAAEGLGSLIAAAWTPRLVARLGSARTVLAAAVAFPVLAVLMPAAQPRWGLLLFAAGNGGYAAATVTTSIVTRTHRQSVTPAALLPRVMATVRFVSWGVVPLGAVAAGLAATWLGARAAMWACCLAALLAPLSIGTSRVARRRDLADADEQAPPAP